MLQNQREDCRWRETFQYATQQQLCAWDIAYKRLGPSQWNHPRNVLHPGTTPSKDCHIRLKHLWDQWTPSTRTVTETPRRHNVRISTQTMRNHIRRFTLRVRRPYRGPILYISSGVLQGSTWLRYNAFPFSICLTHDFPRSNAVSTLPWPAYSPSCTLSSIGEGPHRLSDKITWPTSRHHGAVMPGYPGGLGWHPAGKNDSSEPIMSLTCRVVRETHSLSQPLVALMHYWWSLAQGKMPQ